MSDYPEDLNPFNEAGKKKKSGIHFSSSFRSFGKTIRQSFRGKKKNKNEVEIRHRLEPIVQRQTQAASVDMRGDLALPRSRFRERLAKTYSPTLGTQGPNPFEENNNDEHNHSFRNHRKKKRAPLPPKSSSAQNINEHFDDSRCNSKWSLTSVDTCDTYGGSSANDTENTAAFTQEIKNVTKYLEDLSKLSDEESDHVENIKTKLDLNEVQTAKVPIPDVVVSCASEDNGNSEEQNTTSKKINDCTYEKNQYSSTEDLNDYKENYNLDRNGEDNGNLEKTNSAPSTNSNNSEEDIHVIDITNNLKNADENNITITQNKLNEAISDQQLNFNERKSIYIAGSQDNLDDKDGNYVEKVSLYIAGSREELDNSTTNTNNNNNNDNNIVSTSRKNSLEANDNENHNLKTRKFKLDRNELLGQ